jgi:hypothetical protein
MNYVPPTMHPFDIYPIGIHQKNRNRFPSGVMHNEIEDVPKTSAMATELLDDLLFRQQQFLKRIRKWPSTTDDS